MTWEFIAGVAAATVGAVVSGFTVQFFTYYREKRDEYDELLDTLYWIKTLDKDAWKESTNALAGGNTEVANGGVAALRGHVLASL